MGEAQRLPEVVVAGQVQEMARDVLEVDKLRGFEVWSWVRVGSTGDMSKYLHEMMWRTSSSGRCIMVAGGG
jgi:hypothetical protein